jgi:hypothetical protein
VSVRNTSLREMYELRSTFFVIMADSFHNVESDPLNFYDDYVLGSPAINAATNLRNLMIILCT